MGSTDWPLAQTANDPHVIDIDHVTQASNEAAYIPHSHCHPAAAPATPPPPESAGHAPGARSPTQFPPSMHSRHAGSEPWRSIQPHGSDGGLICCGSADHQSGSSHRQQQELSHCLSFTSVRPPPSPLQPPPAPQLPLSFSSSRRRDAISGGGGSEDGGMPCCRICLETLADDAFTSGKALHLGCRSAVCMCHGAQVAGRAIYGLRAGLGSWVCGCRWFGKGGRAHL